MQTILIIEDDQAILTAYSTVLEKEGYFIIKAPSGPQGISILKNQHIDLILLDIMLPGGMNGYDVLMQLKQSEKTLLIPVIVMTNLESEKKTATECGATDYIVKADTDMKNLVEKVKKYLPIIPS
jgi:CheY-like chemotaxis protein